MPPHSRPNDSISRRDRATQLGASSGTKSRGSTIKRCTCLGGVNFFTGQTIFTRGREGETARGRAVYPRVVVTSCTLLIAGRFSRSAPLAMFPSPVIDEPRRRTSTAMHGRVAVNPNVARYEAYPGARIQHTRWTSPLGRDTARGTLDWPCPGRHVTHLITAFLINASVVRMRLSENKQSRKTRGSMPDSTRSS